MSDTVATRMAADRETLQQQEHGGLDDLHTELDKTPVHEAAREGDLHLLQEIVEKGGVDEIHALDKYGLSALHWAADRGHAECAQYLISEGANVNQLEQRLFRRVPLHFAAIAPSVDTVSLLLEHGADPEAVEYRGWSAYHFAAYAGAVDVLRVLGARGVDPPRRTKAGETALHIAARNGKLEAVRYVLEATQTAEEDALGLCDASGKTALQLALDASHADIVRLLREQTTLKTQAAASVSEASTSTSQSAKDSRGHDARRGSGLRTLDGISTEAASAPAS